MLTKRVALVRDDEGGIDAAELNAVAAAMQMQVRRDLGPIWGVDATVEVFSRLDDVPLGAWPLIVTQRARGAAAGIYTDDLGQPFGLVSYQPEWSLMASHQCLEMLVNPSGNRLAVGPSPEPRQGRVLFLVQICDPCQHSQFAYTIQGVIVSDFYTPEYFASSSITAPTRRTVRYSFNHHITSPREVLKGGFLTWHNPHDQSWWQRTCFGEAPENHPWAASAQRGGQSLREWIHEYTFEHYSALEIAPNQPTTARLQGLRDSSASAARCRAKVWRQQFGHRLTGTNEQP